MRVGTLLLVLGLGIGLWIDRDALLASATPLFLAEAPPAPVLLREQLPPEIERAKVRVQHAESAAHLQGMPYSVSLVDDEDVYGYVLTSLPQVVHLSWPNLIELADCEIVEALAHELDHVFHFHRLGKESATAVVFLDKYETPWSQRFLERSADNFALAVMADCYLDYERNRYYEF